VPNIDHKNSNKNRLGRGLGSLLTMDASDFEDQPKNPISKTEVATKNNFENKRVEPVERPTTSAKAAVPVREISNNSGDISLVNRILSLAVEKIVPNKTQPRKDFNKEPLAELAQSIKIHGVLQPITVRKKGDSYEIIAGERRWRATQIAGLKTIPAIVKDVDNQKSMELALIENLQRENLNSVEEALGFQLLIDEYSLSQQEVSEKVGKSRSTVTNSLRILALPQEVKTMLREGSLSLGHAKVLLGIEDASIQIKLARKSIAQKISVRGLEKEILKITNKTTDQIGSLNVSERLTRGMATDLQKIMGTKVDINYKKGKGKIEIAFYSDEELSQFCEKVKRVWGR
jgi:ParB family transcriptional regulator, chromosome partitioning protein